MKPRAALLLAFFLSGASGLVYEVVWSRQLAALVGGTAAATQAVLATFFVGVTAGAFWLGRRAAVAADGFRFYARLEMGLAGAGLWSAIVLALMARPLAAATDGAQGVATAAVALGATLIACLPATFLMGATYPAVVRSLGGQSSGDASATLGSAYAANTVGAVAGSLLAAFVALPALGARGTLAAAMASNTLAALLAVLSGRQARAIGVHRPRPPETTMPIGGAPEPLAPAALALALAISGFAAISLEVIALRVLAVTLSDTVYTFALAIAAYIGGAFLASTLLARRPGLLTLRPSLALALAAFGSALWLPTLRLGAPLSSWLHGLAPESGAFAAIVTRELLVAIVLATPIALPTTWLFLTLTARAATGGHRSGHGPALGAARATAWNGIGCALAPLVSSMIVLPRAGTWGLAVVAVGSLALLALAVAAAARRQAPRVTSLALVLGLVAATAVPVVATRAGLHAWTVTPGWHLLWAQEGAGATVSVEESPQGQRRLRTNNNFGEGGDAGGVSQIREGMLPTILRPGARSVLLLGVGSGITLAGAVAGLPEASFDAVELLPEIRQAIGMFSRTHRGIERDARVRLHVADARTFAAHAAARGRRYDLVVGELFHATQAGAGALYAREHFEAVARLVAGGGLYCQWLPMHETPPEEVRTVVRTFFRVFPHGGAFLGGWNLKTATLGLVGGDTPLALDWDATALRLAAPSERAARARESELDRLDETLATFVADAESLRRWVGAGPENTDDRPELELGAPRGIGDDLGPTNLYALDHIRRVPDGWVRYGDDARRRQVIAMHQAAGAIFRAIHVWTARDLDGAEAELRAAKSHAPHFAPTHSLLETLAEAWRLEGRPERSTALQRWLSSQEKPRPR